MMNLLFHFEALDKSVSGPRKGFSSSAYRFPGVGSCAGNARLCNARNSGRWLLFSSFPDAAYLQDLLMWHLEVDSIAVSSYSVLVIELHSSELTEAFGSNNSCDPCRSTYRLR